MRDTRESYGPEPYYSSSGGATVSLSDGSILKKSDPRISACGDIQEANSCIGVLLSLATLDPDVVKVLRKAQSGLVTFSGRVLGVVAECEDSARRADDDLVDYLRRELRNLADSSDLKRPHPSSSDLMFLRRAKAVVRRAEVSVEGTRDLAGVSFNLAVTQYLDLLWQVLDVGEAG